METEIVRKHPLAKCEDCPLYKSGTYVPSTFPSKEVSDGKPRLAFIGEAPGKNEIKSGQVFIGMSGKVLDAVLKHHEIDRSTALMTNASACHYPEEEFKSGLPISAVHACRDRLLGELEEANVGVGVTLGANAMKALLHGKEGITLGRAGGPRPSDFKKDLLVVPTFHPAAAMRDHTKFPFLVKDLRKVYDGVWDIWTDPDFHVIKSVVEANLMLVYFWKYQTQPLTVDTESGDDKDIAYGGAIKEVLCIGIWDELKNRAVVFPESVMDKNNRKIMAKLFMRNGLDGQNLKYDNGRVLNVYLGGISIPIKGDRMLQSYALCESPGVHSLDYMGREYQGAPHWKGWIEESMQRGRVKLYQEAKANKKPVAGIMRRKDYALVEPEVLHKYNAFDVAVTRWQRDIFEPMLEEQNLTEFYQWMLGIDEMLVHVEENGMMVDLDYNAELEGEYRNDLGEVEFNIAPDKFNPNSPKQVTTLLESLGINVESTDKDTLNMIIARCETQGRDDVIGFCKSLLNHRAASKMMSTYITGLRKTLINGIAHPSYQLHGSVTGRLTCKGPNLQNIPRGSKLRKQFVAEPGKIFVHADFGQAELRVMAWLAKDEALADIFRNAQRDIFEEMCVRIFGEIQWSSYSKEKKKNLRAMIKTAAYGSAYGRGPNSISTAFGISLIAAKKLQKDFLRMIPGVVKYQSKIKEQACAREDLVNAFGRRRRFKLITNLNRVDIENEAMAHMPQSTANDICMTAARDLDRQGLKLKNLIHDAIIVQCDKGEELEVEKLMRKTMIGVAEDVTEGYVPFKVDVDTGYSYGDF